MSDSSGSKVALFCAGLGIGAIIALLLAPLSGEETREIIGKKTQGGRRYLEEKTRELQKQARATIGRGTETARDLAAIGKQFIGDKYSN